MISRRELLILPSLAIVGWAAQSRASQRVAAEGCHLLAPVGQLGVQSGGIVATVDAEQKLITSSGDATIDHYLGRALVRVAEQFDVYPGFAFCDDTNAENAFATRETKISGTSGTVIFGLNLFHHTLTGFHDDGMAVIAVCAHEFGHIYQYQSGFYDKLTKTWPSVKLAELHADYLAGYFLAARKAAYPGLDLQGAGALFEKLGDTEFTAREHHGTPDQRVASIERGFKFGRGENGDIAAAAVAGERFVVNEFG